MVNENEGNGFFFKKVERQVKNYNHEPGSESESSKENCVYCRETFPNNTVSKDWVECNLCGHWKHDAWAGVEDNDEYICVLRKNIKHNECY